MTSSEREEWDHRYWTRIMILCPDGNDNKDARAIAEREADEWLREWREHN